MKTVTGLHFSRFARAARVVLLLVVMAMLAVLIAGMRPRADQSSPTGTDRNAPAEQPSHYNFPNYA
jgi:hypothetical protein